MFFWGRGGCSGAGSEMVDAKSDRIVCLCFGVWAGCCTSPTASQTVADTTTRQVERAVTRLTPQAPTSFARPWHPWPGLREGRSTDGTHVGHEAFMRQAPSIAIVVVHMAECTQAFVHDTQERESPKARITCPAFRSRCSERPTTNTNMLISTKYRQTFAHSITTPGQARPPRSAVCGAALHQDQAKSLLASQYRR